MMKPLLFSPAGICLLLVSLLVPYIAAAEGEDVPGWFNGYYIYYDYGKMESSSVSCGHDSTFTTSRNFAQCCPSTSTNCPVATECANNAVSFADNAGGYDCADGQSCATMTVYQTSPGGGPSATNVFCWKGWEAYTVYRELPEQTTSDEAAPKTTSKLPTSTGKSGKSTPDSDKKSSSQAWIAGAVIGPVAAIAFALLGFWYIRRRRKGVVNGEHVPTSDYKYIPPEEYRARQQTQQNYELDSRPGPSEMGDSQPSQPSRTGTVHELDAGS